jgi:hypothetical protein
VKEKSWNRGKAYRNQRAHRGPATLLPRQEGGREQRHSRLRTVRNEKKARGYDSSKCVHCRITFTIAFFSKSLRQTALAGRNWESGSSKTIMEAVREGAQKSP